MTAERGWIGEPQPQREWNRSYASARADKILAAQQQRRREILQQVAAGEGRRKQALSREPAGEPTMSVPSEGIQVQAQGRSTLAAMTGIKPDPLVGQRSPHAASDRRDGGRREDRR